MMNSIIREDFDIIKAAYKDLFKEIEGKSVLVVGATGMITTYLSFFFSLPSEALFF